MDGLPVIDISALRRPDGGRSVDDATDDGVEVQTITTAIDQACRRTGFFLVTGHGVDPSLLAGLDAAARAFFAEPETEKATVAMARGGRAWRGWFPEGGELTAGRPDRKEGYYFGSELPPDDPRVVAGRLLHGPNLYPARPAELRPAVEAWMAAMTALGHDLARGVALALGLDGDWFRRELTADPTVLFRIFRYPPTGDEPGSPEDDGWGVAEHTDYGLLTILAHDGTPGLQVRPTSAGRAATSTDGWIDVPAEPDTFVINLGDMLDRMTGGRYRSTPHRVRRTDGDRDRLSFPFFFDPGWDAEIRPVPLPDEAPADDADARWDGTSVHAWEGTYGEYLSAKVAHVFPDLAPD